MLVCTLVSIHRVPNERHGSVSLALLSVCSMIDALIHGAHLFGPARMVSLASTLLFFGLIYFNRLQKIF